MSTKPDWRTVNETLMTHDRKPNDEPPTTEEILAYVNGKLPADAEERMRERLLDYPELVRALATPFPSEPAQPGDPDYLSDAEWSDHWAAFEKRMGRGRVVEFRRNAISAIAAVVAIVFAGLYFAAESKMRRPGIAGEEVQLSADLRRGPADPLPIHLQGDYVLLRPILRDEAHDTYRLAIFDENDRREVWRSGALEAEGKLLVVVPRAFLSPGTYHIRVYGLDGTREELVGNYAVQVYPR